MKETKLQIHIWPDKILRQKCKKVEKVDDSIRDLLAQMHALMVMSDGIGLAANQAGLDISLVVIGIKERVYKLVNPEIVCQEGSIVFAEGCLSFPGIEINIKRFKKIRVKALDEEGRDVEIDIHGTLAVVFQHEIDHINGIPFIDRISFWNRILIEPKLKKIKKTGNIEINKR